MYDSPFKDSVGVDSVPKKGSGSGEYDAAVAPDVPGRDKSPNGLSELTFDTHFGDPKLSGPVKTPFKDAVD